MATVSKLECPVCLGTRVTVAVPGGRGTPLAPDWYGRPLPTDTLVVSRPWSSKSGLTWREAGARATWASLFRSGAGAPEQVAVHLLPAGTRLRIVPEAVASLCLSPLDSVVERWRDRQPVPGWLKSETVGLLVADHWPTDILAAVGEPRQLACARCLARAAGDWPAHNDIRWLDVSGDEPDHVRLAYIRPNGEPKGSPVEHFAGYRPTGEVTLYGQPDPRRALAIVGQAGGSLTYEDEAGEGLTLAPGRYLLYCARANV